MPSLDYMLLNVEYKNPSFIVWGTNTLQTEKFSPFYILRHCHMRIRKLYIGKVYRASSFMVIARVR